MEKPNFNTSESELSKIKENLKVENTKTPFEDVFNDLTEVYDAEIQKNKNILNIKGMVIKEVSEEDAIPNEDGHHNLPFGMTP